MGDLISDAFQLKIIRKICMLCEKLRGTFVSCEGWSINLFQLLNLWTRKINIFLMFYFEFFVLCETYTCLVPGVTSTLPWVSPDRRKMNIFLIIQTGYRGDLAQGVQPTLTCRKRIPTTGRWAQFLFRHCFNL